MTARSALKTVGALSLLGVTLPANLAVTTVALATARLGRPPRRTAEHPKTVLISGGKMTKALQLARSFHQAGHRVVLVEADKYRLTGHRFSTAVDRFIAVPAPDAPGYAQALLQIVREEGVDVYVPVCSPLASYHDALAKAVLAEHCEVVHLEPDMVAALDDKERFTVLAASLGLPVPESHRITDPQQVTDLNLPARGKTYILKSIAYDPVHRLDLTELPRPTPAETAAFVARLPISEANPWVLQEYVRGVELCTHSTVRNGHVQVWACCPSSPFQVNYAMVDRPRVRAWVETFARELALTGQVAFDLIEAADGTPYVIECNPRTHSAITMFYDHPDLAAAYLEPGYPSIEPTATSRPTYWAYHEGWRMLRHPRSAPERLRVVLAGKEAIFDRHDPLPFLLEHHLQIPLLLARNLLQRKDFLRIDFNIGKLVEPAGD